MIPIQSGQLFINEVDVYEEYGAFLSELKQGDRANVTAILTPSSVKENIAVNFREVDGEKYAEDLSQVNEARDVTLCFCIYAKTKAEWLAAYMAFIKFLKTGNKGWLIFSFPTINLKLTMFYKSSSSFSPISNIWREGVQASHFKVTFREPEPIL